MRLDEKLCLSDYSLVVNLALYLLLDHSNRASRTSTNRASWAVALLTFVAVVIRAEVAGLLALFTIQLLSNGSLSITRLMKVGIISTGISIGMPFVWFVLTRTVRPHAVPLHSVDGYS
jgi:hypothetical protein